MKQHLMEGKGAATPLQVWDLGFAEAPGRSSSLNERYAGGARGVLLLFLGLRFALVLRFALPPAIWGGGAAAPRRSGGGRSFL